MAPELLRFIEQANNIATSERWRVLNERIVEISQNSSLAAKWTLKVHAPLARAVFSEYLALKEVYASRKAGDINLLAWRARNLLELSIWCIYCCLNDKNAGRFYEDAGRDGLDLLDKFKKWGESTKQDLEWLRSFQEAGAKLRANALSNGAFDLDGAYMKVHDAAKNCGIEVNFEVAYKFLSKFAHPTAFSLLSSMEVERQFIDSVLSLGCLFFVGAFEQLERYFVVEG